MVISALRSSHNAFCMCSFGLLAYVGEFGMTMGVGQDAAEEMGRSPRTGTSSPIASGLPSLV